MKNNLKVKFSVRNDVTLDKVIFRPEIKILGHQEHLWFFKPFRATVT